MKGEYMNGEGPSTASSRETHHGRGFRSYRQMKTDGLGAIRRGIEDLDNLIRVVAEGNVPPPPKDEKTSGEVSADAPLHVYLTELPEKLDEVKDAMIELAVQLTDKVDKLKNLLF